MKKIMLILLIFGSIIPINAEWDNVSSTTYYLYQNGLYERYSYPDEDRILIHDYENNKKFNLKLRDYYDNNKSYTVDVIDSQGLTSYYSNFSAYDAWRWLIPRMVTYPRVSESFSYLYVSFDTYFLSIYDLFPPLLVDPDFKIINKVIYNFTDASSVISGRSYWKITYGDIISNMTSIEFMNENNWEEGRKQLQPDTRKWQMGFYLTEWIGNDDYQVKYNTSISLEYQENGKLLDFIVQYQEKTKYINTERTYNESRYLHLSLFEEKTEYFPIISGYYADNISMINIILLIILFISYRITKIKNLP